MAKNPEREALKQLREQDWDAALGQLPSVLALVGVLPDTATVGEAKRYVADNARRGCVCPVTGRHSQAFRRKMYRSVAECLTGLVHSWHATQDWVHVGNIMVPRYDSQSKRLTMVEATTSAKTRGGDLAKAVHWGLAVQRENDDSKKRTSGLWMPTQTGVDFISGKNTIPSHVFLFNNLCLGWTREYVSITDALGFPFNYAELMSGD